MRPPLLGLFPKVVPAGGVEYHGQFLPGGTHICMNTSSLLHSKSLFGNDPSVFRPERFMEASEDTCSERRKNLELAFSHGQNQCLGKTIAIMELSKVTFEVRAQYLRPVRSCLLTRVVDVPQFRFSDSEPLAVEPSGAELWCFPRVEYEVQGISK